MSRRVVFLLAAALFLVSALHGTGAETKLSFAQGTDANALDPANATGTVTASIIFHMYNALTRTTSDGEVVGDLATSFKALNDTTWEFKLRKGVKFHNGEDFNAASVKFTVDRILDTSKKYKMTSDFLFIKEVKIIDDYTINLITKTPYAGTPLRMFYLSMVPPKYLAEKGDAGFAASPVGTGPYKFVSWKKDSQLVLEAYKDYYAGAPAIDKVAFRVIPDDASRVAALEAGDIDLISGVPSSQVARLSQNPNLVVAPRATTRVMYIGMNTIIPGPLQDKRVRQALNYAVDVDSIVKNVLDGNGTVLATISTPQYFGYAPDVKPYKRDVAKAKQLLKEAGYEKGFAVDLSFVPGAMPGAKDAMQVVAAQMAEVGVTVNPVEIENALMIQQLASKKISPLFFQGIGGPYADLELISRISFGTNERYSAYSNITFDDLRNKASATIDPTKAKELWKQLQEMARDEAPAIFLFQQFSIYAYNKKLMDWKPRLDQMILTYGSKFGK
jgi:peptide/nickel transport system substrate-binding protein